MPYKMGDYFDGLDGWADLSNNIDRLARVGEAITSRAGGGHDETGGMVTCLTEAVMGVTAGLCEIAEAIDGLADAVRGVSSKEPSE